MKRILLSSALVVASAAAAQAATLVNGSFESTPSPLSVGSFDTYSAIDGWTLTSGPSIEVQSTGVLTFVDAHDGNNYVELTSSSPITISQDVFLTRGSYELSFFYSPRETDAGNLGLNNMSFGVTGLFSEDVLNAPNLDLPRGEWTEIAETFLVAVDGVYTINFAGTDPTEGGRGALIDAVELAAVPLPAAGLLLLTALGAAASTRRKR